MKYSVIIPVYNLEEYIENTLSELTALGDKNEIIVVDDGSTDNSLNIIKTFVENNKQVNIKVISQENAGVSSARNAGIAAANGDYLVFADGDDILDCNIMSLEISADTDIFVWRFQTGPEGTYKASQVEFEKTEYSAYEFLESLLVGKNKIRIGSFAVKREHIVRNNISFTEGCAICEDVEFMYKLILTAEKIVPSNEVLYTYIKREGSAINTFDMRRFEAPLAINRLYAYAANLNRADLDEFVMDSLKYGLFITHCMFSFDSCCRYIKNKQELKDFWNQYKSDCKDIENKIKEAKMMMRYEPQIFSWKRRKLFLFSRKMYASHMCNLEE